MDKALDDKRTETEHMRSEDVVPVLQTDIKWLRTYRRDVFPNT